MGILAKKIDREQLKQCAFIKPTNSQDDFELSERNKGLYLAMLMGNNYESKVKIVFNTTEGYREILTLVWATTEKYVMLKEGNSIPIEAIAYVELKNNSKQNANGIF